MFGQVHVIDSLVDRIQMIKSRLCAPGRPLATYLFTGPTGVGKTLVSKTLAGILVGDESRLIRFDMSEFHRPDSVGRFVGGSSRSMSGIGLVDAALAEPFPVILLDEIEKAHWSVFDVLLQVLGEGRLTDEGGRTAYYTNAVLIMTSNLGGSEKSIRHPAPPDEMARHHEHAEAAVRRHFRPEFVNRLTDIFTFRALGRDEIEAVALRELRSITTRHGLSTRRVRVRVTQRVVAEVVRRGYSPEYGVRPMERAVDSLIGVALARFLAERPRVSDVRLLTDLDSDASARVGSCRRRHPRQP